MGGPRPGRRRRALIVVVGSMALVASTIASPVLVHAAPASLSGEGLGLVGFGGTTFGSELIASCNDPSTTTSFAYDLPYASEPFVAEAIGPYPGTFTASGTVTIGPQTLGSVGFSPAFPPYSYYFPGSRDAPTGPLVSLEAAFEIDSPAGHVVGTQSLLTTANSWGACDDDLAGSFTSGQELAGGTIRNAGATLSYEATITTPAGAFQDHGTSRYIFEEWNVQYLTGGGAVGGNFYQGFESAGPTYAFGGFQQPVDPLPTVNSMQAGAAVPVKFSLGGNQGLDIFVTGYPKSQAITCDSTALVDGIEETVTAGGSSLSYEEGADRYRYVWKTEKSWAGTCRQLVLKFADGSSARANFQFK